MALISAQKGKVLEKICWLEEVLRTLPRMINLRTFEIFSWYFNKNDNEARKLFKKGEKTTHTLKNFSFLIDSTDQHLTLWSGLIRLRQPIKN